MWIFTKDAFISVVADKDNPDSNRLLARARKKDHLTVLFPHANVFSVPGSDYAYRSWISRDELKAVMAREIDELNYPNFKNAIVDEGYHNAATRVWWAMYNYQDTVDLEFGIN